MDEGCFPEIVEYLSMKYVCQLMKSHRTKTFQIHYRSMFFFPLFYSKTIDYRPPRSFQTVLLISNVTKPKKQLSFCNFHYQYLLTLT